MIRPYFFKNTQYMKEYKAINCSYYDYIEHFAVLRQVVHIQYLNDSDESSSIKSIILDTKNDGHAEYMIVKNLDQPIRLDRIISIEDKVLADYSNCKL